MTKFMIFFPHSSKEKIWKSHVDTCALSLMPLTSSIEVGQFFKTNVKKIIKYNIKFFIKDIYFLKKLVWVFFY